MKKALAIDGNSLFYRMYYATQNQVEIALKNNWTPNNGIKLMLSSINKIISNNQYDYIFIAFDHGTKTFRHELGIEYKAKRQKTPDELIKQMKDTIKILDALGYCVMSKEGVEADDLIGSFSNIMATNGIQCDIYSSDKDLLQLVNKNVSVKLLKAGLTHVDEFNDDNFQSKFFNLTPRQIIDYKAIVGDKSDNLPGINGIGEKTGIDLLNKYQSLENIYDHLNELSIKNQEKFISQKDIAYTCKKMATILLDELDSCQLEAFTIKNKKNEIIKEIVIKYQLFKLNFLVEDRLF